jgi:hypothetical protein
MAWIETVPAEQAGPDLRRVYEAVYALYPADYRDPVASLARADGSNESVVAAHSLIPEAMRHMMSGFGVLLQPDLPLTRRQHEMIAAAVSARNRCVY